MNMSRTRDTMRGRVNATFLGHEAVVDKRAGMPRTDIEHPLRASCRKRVRESKPRLLVPSGWRPTSRRADISLIKRFASFKSADDESRQWPFVRAGLQSYDGPY
jgi:hypothetical protein